MFLISVIFSVFKYLNQTKSNQIAIHKINR